MDNENKGGMTQNLRFILFGKSVHLPYRSESRRQQEWMQMIEISSGEC